VRPQERSLLFSKKMAFKKFHSRNFPRQMVKGSLNLLRLRKRNNRVAF
jgi:hypothetical protein